jgi:hypothetical protein
MLSGDGNPIHVDKIYSRRSMYGEPVVHGINQVLYALETLLSKTKKNLLIDRIKVQFKKPAFLDKEVEVKVEQLSPLKNILSVYTDGILTTKIDISFSPFKKDDVNVYNCDVGAKYNDIKPKFVSKEDLKNCSGVVKTLYDVLLMKTCYTNVSKYLRCDQIGVILASTRIIGTVCPGLNSLFSECDLTFSRENNKTASYVVKKFDDRLNFLTISVSGSGFNGELAAFIRPDLVKQKSFFEVKKIVNSRDFSGERALIIGGSRGLGEIALKIISAGGGSAVFTYFSGEDDALGLAKEINDNGGSVSCIKLDVTSDDSTKLVERICSEFSVTSCYYFATPKIIPQKDSIFSASLYYRYYRFYIEFFIRIINVLNKNKVINIFYPSTIFIDKVPDGMSEYASVKAAAEILFSSLNSKGFNIYCPRLPALATDQTTKLYGPEVEDSCDIIYDELKKFKGFIERI